MPRLQTLTDVRIRRLRAEAQLLHRPRRMHPADVVRHLVGVQSQVPAAAALALRARARGLTAEGVTRALTRDRSIVLTWAMRGTWHLVAAEDHGPFVPLLTEPYVGRARRRLREEGMAGEQASRAIALIGRMLAAEGPLTRAEITQRLARQRIQTKGQAIAHLMWLGAFELEICAGPEREGQRTYVLVREWLGPRERPDPEAALAELAVRYLRAHAPARPQDLAAWAGIRSGDAGRAWGGVADRLVEVSAPDGPLWTLRNQAREASKVPVRLVPAFDECLLGWRDRSHVLARDDAKRVNAGGGWIRPVMLDDGRAIGTWSLQGRSTRHRLSVAPFGDLPARVHRELSAETADLARFLGARVELG